MAKNKRYIKKDSKRIRLMKALPNILAIDPSIRACGWATFDSRFGIRKIEAGTIKSYRKKEEHAAHQIQEQLLSILQNIWDCTIGKNTYVIIEKPKLYENWSENKKRGIEKLLIAYGVYISICHFDWLAWTPTVQEWKGQLPKDVSHKNTAKILDREKIDYSYAGLDHNAKDAIALIVAYLQKERFI